MLPTDLSSVKSADAATPDDLETREAKLNFGEAPDSADGSVDYATPDNVGTRIAKLNL